MDPKTLIINKTVPLNDGYLLAHYKDILKSYKEHSTFFEHNKKLQAAMNDDLLSLMEEVANRFENAQARKDNKDMAVAINWFKQIVDHQSQLYTFEVLRKSTTAGDQGLLDEYVTKTAVDSHAAEINRYFNGTKSGLMEIYPNREGVINLRPVANDKFGVWTDDTIEPNRPTVYYKIICSKKIKKGYSTKTVDILHLYTDEEFMEVQTDETILGYYQNDMGVAPFAYVNKESYRLMPRMARDLLQNVLMLNTMYTNSIVCSYYQGHPTRVLKNVDKDASSISINPHEYIVLNSKEGSVLNPELTELASTLDTSKILAQVKQMLEDILRNEDIKPNDAVQGNQSGISLQLKNADMTENRKNQINKFIPFEQELWRKLAKVHNNLADKLMLAVGNPAGKFSDDFDVEVSFELPDTAKQVMNDEGGAEEEKPSAPQEPAAKEE